MQLFTVQDLASETFLKPFSMKTDRDAKDGFAHVINEPETPYNKHPEDYILMSIGSFDERTGILSVSDKKTIARAIELKAKKLTNEEISEKASELINELEGEE